MKLYEIDKTLNLKRKVNILDSIRTEICYDFKEDQEIKLIYELIKFSLEHFKDYDLYIDLVNLWKKALDIKDFMKLLKEKIKISHETRYIKGGETMIKHDFINIGKNKYICGEVVC